MKSLAEYILSPLTVICFFLITGNFLLFIKKYWKLGRYLVLTGLFLLLIFSFGPLVNLLVNQLEYRFPPITAEKLAEVDTIVLLPGWAGRNPDLPISSQVSRSTIARLCEAIRLLQINPKANLLITGGGKSSSLRRDLAVSMVIGDLAVSLGVARKRIICETESQNTYESAIYVEKYVGSKPLVLVTSAMHMPRAMGVFRRSGMNPIPAPADYRSVKGNPLNLQPQSDSFTSWVRRVAEFQCVQDLVDFTDAVHECLGLLWYRIVDIGGSHGNRP